MIDRLREAYRAVGFGEEDVWTAVLHPDIVFEDRMRPEPRALQGRDRLVRLLADFADAWEAIEYEPERFVDAGDRIAVVLRLTGKGRSNPAPVTIRIGHVIELRDGLVVRMTSWPDPQQALDAVAAGDRA